MKTWATRTILILLFAIPTAPLFAQTLIEIVPELDDVIEATIVPKIPEAHENVTITVKNFSSDFTRSTIAWYLNDTLRSEGAGQTTFSFPNGSVGETTTVRMVANVPSGRVVERTFTFTPVEIALLWESETYAPPLYKGKKLHSTKAPLTITALPNFKRGSTTIDPENLIYTWTIDEKPRSDLSGYGRQSITLRQTDTFRKNVVAEVRIATTDNSIVGTERITVQTITPFVLLYPVTPLLGTQYQNAALTDYTLTSSEIRFIAEPYFFTASDATNLNYTWSINNKTIEPTDILPNRITLRHTEGKGTANLKVEATHSSIIEQQNQNTLRIRFGN